MFERFPNLVLPTFVLGCFGPVAVAVTVFELNPGWIFIVGFPLFLIGVGPVGRYQTKQTSRIEAEKDTEEEKQRLQPIRDALTSHGPLLDPGPDGRVKLLRHLAEALGVTPELPPTSGLPGDGFMEYGGADWYFIVEPELTLGRRFTIQGKVEDLLRCAGREGRDLWVLAIVGVEESEDYAQMTDIRDFAHYAVSRSDFSREKDNAGSNVCVDVLMVMVGLRHVRG